VLARLEGANQRVRRLVVVSSRVPFRGVVAAADVAAGQADPQVEPLAADAEAVFAAGHFGRELAHRDLVEVGAAAWAHRTPARCATAPRRGGAAGCRCTTCRAIGPSPPAVAQRFVEPERTSPAAKIPGTLVSSR